MAKYRHRVFEMYDFFEEACLALKPKATGQATESSVGDSQTFKYLVVTCSATITRVEFKNAEDFGKDNVTDLGRDLSQLADGMERGGKVLLDFTGVKSFSPECIASLVLLNQNLRHKGGRIALCCLDPATRESFFASTAK